MIEKIIYNYYYKRFKSFLNDFLLSWKIDFKLEEKNQTIYLFIKKHIYNDKQYHMIYSFSKKKCLDYLLEKRTIMKILEQRIDEYYELIGGNNG